MTLGKDLVSRGYFPREVPQTFSTTALGTLGAKLGLAKLAAAGGPKNWTIPVRHNLARPAGLRRPLALPNPIGYLAIAEAIGEAWVSIIEPHLSTARYSASLPTPSDGSRAFITAERGDRETLSAMARQSGRILVHADVQNFYPSIYTHSIAWALHGKEVAKSSKHDATLLGNRLDKGFQSIQAGQTVGIPIGPDASWIVAECIFADVEARLRRNIKGKIDFVAGYRYIDDVELTVATVSDAETALVTLQEALAAYELSLNPRKTRIVELPEPHMIPGMWELAEWKFRSDVRGQRRDLIGYFDCAFRQIMADRGGKIAAYSVGRLRHFEVRKANWQLLQSYLLQLLVAEPSCSRLVAELLGLNAERGHTINRLALAKAVERLAVRHCPMGHGSEVAWALWLSIAHKALVNRRTALAVSSMSDNLVALLALHARDVGLVRKGLDTERWAAQLMKEQLRGEHWLLSYEAAVRGWLPSMGRGSHVTDDPFFAILKNEGVTFFDPSAFGPPPSLGGSVAGVSG